MRKERFTAFKRFMTLAQENNSPFLSWNPQALGDETQKTYQEIFADVCRYVSSVNQSAIH